MKYKHYAPKAPLYIVEDINEEIKKHSGKKIGVMTTESAEFDSSIIHFHLGETPEDYAHNLFKALRFFDLSDVEVIISQDIKGGGICEAVRNRLYKAAENR
jgi:L-threonylcarbamoyladenylate synthase